MLFAEKTSAIAPSLDHSTVSAATRLSSAPIQFPAPILSMMAAIHFPVRDFSFTSFPQASLMRGPGSKASLLFQLVVPATAIFIMTTLSMIAVLFSDQRAPLAQWLNQHGNTLLAIEFVAVIVLSFLAMAADRIQTLRRIKAEQQATKEALGSNPNDVAS